MHTTLMLKRSPALQFLTGLIELNPVSEVNLRWPEFSQTPIWDDLTGGAATLDDYLNTRAKPSVFNETLSKMMQVPEALASLDTFDTSDLEN